MRNLLLTGLAALLLSFSGPAAFAVGAVSPVQTAELRPVLCDVVKAAPALDVGQGDDDAKSFAAAAGKIFVLAGVGLIGTLAAVGLRRVWAQDPIRYPCQ